MPKRSEENDYVIDLKNKSIRMSELLRIGIQGEILTKSLFSTFDAFDCSRIDIVDLASGAGELVLRLAGKFPGSRITGVDIMQEAVNHSNAQALTQGRKNATFQCGNILHPLDFAENTFDLTLARFIAGVVPRSYWPAFVEECYRITKPGGHIMLTEPEIVIAVDCPAFDRMVRVFVSAFYDMGKGFSRSSLGISPMLAKLIGDAGYVDVKRQMYTIDCSPESPYHADLVRDYIDATQLFRESEGVRNIFMQQMSEEELNRECDEMERELRNNFRADWLIMVATGTKSA